MSAGAAAASAAASGSYKGLKKHPDDWDWKGFLYFILMVSGVIGVILLIAWYAGTN